MMLMWLAIYLFAAFFATRWADFLAIIACTAPMLIFKRKHRGETFGTRDCNTLKYKKREYVWIFLLCISGCALISAFCYLLFSSGEPTATSRSDFLYLLVFGCFLPAFFEEWFVRGGILGALSQYGGRGVLVCALFFMLMHITPEKYPYALFAGLVITVLVYLTECIYLGMLLHFLNNLASLLLSYLPRGNAEYIALAALAVVFVLSIACLRCGAFLNDAKELILSVKTEEI